MGLGDLVAVAVQSARAVPADGLAFAVVAVGALVSWLAAVVLIILHVDAAVGGLVLVSVELASVVGIAVCGEQ